MSGGNGRLLGVAGAGMSAEGLHLFLDEVDRGAVVLDRVDEEEHLVEGGEEPEGGGEDEPDGGEDGGAAADEVGGADDQEGADDERGFEDVAEAAVDDAEPARRRC